MLIIEGPDLVGKTTLAGKFLEALPRHMYRHFGLLPPHFDYFHDYDIHSGHYFVQDRFHMSELVYGTVCRGQTPITPNLYRFIDAMLTLKGMITVVICFEDPAMLKERYKERKEMYDVGQCLAVNSAYFDIENTFDRYDIQYDFFIKLNEDMPYVTDRQAQIILDAYLERQEEMFNIC